MSNDRTREGVKPDDERDLEATRAPGDRRTPKWGSRHETYGWTRGVHLAGRFPDAVPADRVDGRPVKISLGLRARNNGIQEALAYVRSTAEAGIDGYWTVATPDYDPFVVIGQAWATAQPMTTRTLYTGIGVLPVADWTIQSVASAAATVSALQGGRFRLGIGAGRVDSATWRAGRGLREDLRPVAVIQECLTALRGLLRGESVCVDGAFVRLLNVSIETCPPAVELYVGAAGPAIMDVAGHLADGVLCSLAAPEDLSATATRLAEARAISDIDKPANIAVNVSAVLDPDRERALDRLVRSTCRLALGVPGMPATRGFPGQLRRLGFNEDLDTLAHGVADSDGISSVRQRLSGGFVRRLGVAGNLEDVAAGVAAYASVADEVNLTFPAGIDVDRLPELLSRVRQLSDDWTK